MSIAQDKVDDTLVVSGRIACVCEIMFFRVLYLHYYYVRAVIAVIGIIGEYRAVPVFVYRV